MPHHTLKMKRRKQQVSLQFQVGKECYRRVWLYHQLHHYRFKLLERVGEELDAMKPVAFNAQDGEQQSALVTALLEDSVIMTQLFAEFKQLLDQAECGYSI